MWISSQGSHNAPGLGQYFKTFQNLTKIQKIYKVRLSHYTHPAALLPLVIISFCREFSQQVATQSSKISWPGTWSNFSTWKNRELLCWRVPQLWLSFLTSGFWNHIIFIPQDSKKNVYYFHILLVRKVLFEWIGYSSYAALVRFYITGNACLCFVWLFWTQPVVTDILIQNEIHWPAKRNLLLFLK